MTECLNYVVWSSFFSVLVEVFLPWSFFVVVISSAVALFHRLAVSSAGKSHHYMLICSFVTLGAVTGFLSGASREPVVGTVLPAILTLISGALAVLFSSETRKEWRPAIPSCLIGMLAASLLNAFAGSTARNDFESYQAELARWNYVLDEVSKAKLQPIIEHARAGTEILISKPNCG